MSDGENFDFDEHKKQNDLNKRRLNEERAKVNSGILSKCNLKEETKSWASPFLKKRWQGKKNIKRFPNGKIVSIAQRRSLISIISPKNANEKEIKKDAAILPFKIPDSILVDPESKIREELLSPFSLPSRHLVSVYVDSLSRIYVSFIDGQGPGLAISFDQGISWVKADRKLWGDIDKISLENDGLIYIRSLTNINGKRMSTVRRSLNGKSWKETILKQCPEGHKVSFCTDFLNAIYSGTSEGLFISKNNGLTWTSVLPHGWLKDSRVLAIAKKCFSRNGKLVSVLYVVTMSGIIISFDNGVRWQKVSSEASKFCTAFYVDHHGTIYIGLSKHGLFISSDDGKTWKRRDWEDGLCKGYVQDIKGKDGVIYVSHSSEEGDESSGGISISKNNGESFSSYNSLNSSLTARNYGDLFINSKNQFYACSSDGGLFISDNFRTWLNLVPETVNYSGLKIPNLPRKP